MNIVDYLKDIFTNPTVIIFGAVTLFEIVPIKINPWSTLFRWIGKAINGELKEQLSDLSSDVSELKSDFEMKKAEDMRWEILEFANTCRIGNEHSKDEWRHVMNQVSEYEEYTERKGITNGVIEEDTRFLRELYHERNLRNDFL